MVMHPRIIAPAQRARDESLDRRLEPLPLHREGGLLRLVGTASAPAQHPDLDLVRRRTPHARRVLHPKALASLEEYRSVGGLSGLSNAHTMHPDRQRKLGYDRFLHFYNHRRAHGALGWSTPSAATRTLRDNVPGVHS
jgi:hypothetical protein